MDDTAKPAPKKMGRPRKRDLLKSLTFDEAVNGLPETVPLSVEIDWIRAHPALRRKPNTNGFIELIVDDVIEVSTGYCQHPVAPSKSAVNSLEFYANNRNELYKLLTGGSKKGGAGSSPVGVIEEEDIDVHDIQKYLDQLKE